MDANSSDFGLVWVKHLTAACANVSPWVEERVALRLYCWIQLHIVLFILLCCSCANSSLSADERVASMAAELASALLRKQSPISTRRDEKSPSRAINHALEPRTPAVYLGTYSGQPNKRAGHVAADLGRDTWRKIATV